MPQSSADNVREMYRREADKKQGGSTFQSGPISELVKASQAIKQKQSVLPSRATGSGKGQLQKVPQSLLALKRLNSE